MPKPTPRFKVGDVVWLKPWNELPITPYTTYYLGIAREIWDSISKAPNTISAVRQHTAYVVYNVAPSGFAIKEEAIVADQHEMPILF